MTVQVVPAPPPGVPFWTSTTTLEGTDFVFSFAFNQREATWYLQISQPNPTGDPTLLAAFCIVSNWPLLRRYTDTRLPLGELIAACSPTGDTSPPGLNDFGPTCRCQLLYFPSSDLAIEQATAVSQVLCSDTTSGDVYTVTVGGQVLSYTVPGGATGPSVAAAIAALLGSLTNVLAATVGTDPITGNPTNLISVATSIGTVVTCTTKTPP